ncbi:MAG: xanthine dehydrogenase small subunit [Rhizobiales bacterium]|nr:xanthine dehydrogenase small subunit [Hyphomicrobiales bacterium]
MRQTIRFIRKGHMVELDQMAPTTMLLDYLREVERATGTKEGCGEGDCGACTVAVGRLKDGKLAYEPVNACIHMLGQVDGCEIVTVEDIAEDDGKLHPIQAAMVQSHASQCGFCTPGFVMSLFTLYQSTDGKLRRDEVNDWIAGNLCRCTGYRPIVDAAVAASAGTRNDRFRVAARDTAGLLSFLADNDDVFIGDSDRFFAAPATVDGLADLYEQHPNATIVGGATDVGLWVNKQLRDLPKIIHTGRARGLDQVQDTGYELIIGGAATYATVEPFLAALDPDIGELLRRLGSRQVRSRGTVGGNVANGSPIGDTPPLLIALGASVELRKGKRVRTLPVEEFYIEYGKQAREPGELLTAILVPKLDETHIFRCFKVAKRFDQDISSVMGAFRFTVGEGGIITEARIAFGGMAGIPKRAAGAEAALQGAALRDSRAWARAFAALRDDFQPLDDHRASARYRVETAHALLGKALIEAAGTSTSRTRIVGRREKVADGSR